MRIALLPTMPRAMKKGPAKKKAKRLPVRQLTLDEQLRIDSWMREDKASPAQAWHDVNARRQVQGIAPVHKSTVHRYAKGATHAMGAAESRGRPKSLSRADVRKLDLARRRLVKKANNEARITYAEVIEEAALKSAPCQRVCV